MTQTPGTLVAPRTRPRLVCFSFAAYAKTLIQHLRSHDVPILPGLSDAEFTSIEARFRFHFPSDLRLFLREGVPAGPEFPNWRSSSVLQLQVFLSLPMIKLLGDVSRNGFWVDSWGPRPADGAEALRLAKIIAGENGDGNFDNVPTLIPLIRNCYVPSTSQHVTGSPVFLVAESGVKIISFDIARFLTEQVHHFLLATKNECKDCIELPIWVANEAKRIDFWTEVVSSGSWMNALLPHGDKKWWCKNIEEFNGLEKCLELVYWKLKNGGWKEEEVNEIMVKNPIEAFDVTAMDVRLLMRSMSVILLSAGWSTDDVVYSLGDFEEDDGFKNCDCGKERLFWSFGPNCVGEPPARYDPDFFTINVL